MRRIVFITLAVLLSQYSFGQRTSSSTFFTELGLNYNYNLGSINVDFGQYGQIGYWDVMLRSSDQKYLFSTGSELKRYLTTLSGGYNFRLVSTISRSISLYAGVAGIIGIDSRQDRRIFYGGNQSEYAGRSFVFGLKPKLTAEFFLTDFLALTLNADIPILFGVKVGGMFNYHTGFGIRYNF